MQLPIFVVDAFSHEQFKGNSAAVVLLDEWLEDQTMLAIAQENNLSETAFIVALPDNSNANPHYFIRWFSPITEIDFCGHATLATSFVLFDRLGTSGEILFETGSVGQLTVSQSSDGAITMRFPNQSPEPIEAIPDALINGLSIKPESVLRNRQAYFAVYPSSEDIFELEYDSEQLKQLAPYDVVVTAKSQAPSGAITRECLNQSQVPEIDFVSRYFWPANGGDEDPVTGSIHAGLTPYWASRLNKMDLVAYQASARGGMIRCRLDGDTVIISGHAILYLQGTIEIGD